MPSADSTPKLKWFEDATVRHVRLNSCKNMAAASTDRIFEADEIRRTRTMSQSELINLPVSAFGQYTTARTYPFQSARE